MICLKTDRLDLSLNHITAYTNEKQSNSLPVQWKKLAHLTHVGSGFHIVLNCSQKTISHVCRGIEQVFGLKPENTTLDQITDLIYPEDRKHLKKKAVIIEQFFNKKKSSRQQTDYKVVYSYRVRDRKGRLKTLLTQASVLPPESDEQDRHMLISYTDISHLGTTNSDKVSFINTTTGTATHIDVNAGPAPHKKKSLSDTLSSRELEIVKLLAGGSNAEQIARSLNISFNTVRTHRKNILKKTQCKNTTELVAQCMSKGLIHLKRL